MESNKKKVLITEDDIFLANAYKVKLEQAGYEVEILADGEDVMQSVSKQKPDLMILDLMMPRKSGFDVLKELKANPDYKDIPILIATNLGQDEDKSKAKRLGATEYVVKSEISLQDLVPKINNLLS